MPTISFTSYKKGFFMKNILLAFCLSLSVILLYGMELTDKESNCFHREDSKKTILQNDYKNFLSKRLQAYKKQPFSYDDIKYMEDTYVEMTSDNSLSIIGDCLHKDVRDEDENNFVHHAVKSRDLKTIEWAVKRMKCPLSTPNNLGKEPFDLCIDQLMPDETETNKQLSDKIFTALAFGALFGVLWLATITSSS